MAIKKRQIIIATMVLALGVAVYLNWQFSGEKDLKATETLNTVNELGESQFVNNPSGLTSSEGTASAVQGGVNSEAASSDSSQPQGNTSGGAATQTGGSSATQYFAEARLNRQKARDESSELLTNIVKDLESTDKAKVEAVQQAADLAKVMENEVSMENIIKAKGYADCMVHIQNDTCNVVVQAEDLLPSDAITIRDVVNSQASIAHEKIKIVNVK